VTQRIRSRIGVIRPCPSHHFSKARHRFVGARRGPAGDERAPLKVIPPLGVTRSRHDRSKSGASKSEAAAAEEAILDLGWAHVQAQHIGDLAAPVLAARAWLQASFARSGETFFAFGFLLQFAELPPSPATRLDVLPTPSLPNADIPPRIACTLRRHASLLPPTPAWESISRNFGFLFTKI
jgi:hypothetical protein